MNGNCQLEGAFLGKPVGLSIIVVLLWIGHLSHSWERGKRFHPGTVALREIRKYQKSTQLLISEVGARDDG